MAGRTLLQQALPITFGLKAAGWLDSALDGARAARLGAARVQLGGAAGTLASLGSEGARVAGLAGRSGWSSTSRRCRGTPRGCGSPTWAPRWPWRPACWRRSRSTWCCCPRPRSGEVAEPSDGGRGGSSTLPHKRNPVGSVLAIACARRVRGAAGGAARGDAPGARARRRRLAVRVGSAERGAGADRRCGVRAARGARGPRGEARPDAREPRRDGRAADGGERWSTALAGQLGPATGAGAGRRRRRAGRSTAGGRCARSWSPTRGCERELSEEEIDRALDPRRLPRLGRCLHRPRPVTLSGGIVSVDVHHSLEGPDDAPAVVFSNSLGTDGRHVGRAGGGVLRALPCAALRHARPRRDPGAARAVHDGRARGRRARAARPARRWSAPPSAGSRSGA